MCPAPWMSASGVDRAASYASSCSSVMSSICNSCQRQVRPCRVAWRTTRTTTSSCVTTRQIPSRSRGCQSGTAAIPRLMPWPAARSPTTGLERLTLRANVRRHTTDTSTALACSADRDREAPVIVGLRLCTPMNNPSAGTLLLTCPTSHRDTGELQGFKGKRTGNLCRPVSRNLLRSHVFEIGSGSRTYSKLIAGTSISDVAAVPIRAACCPD